MNVNVTAWTHSHKLLDRSEEVYHDGRSVFLKSASGRDATTIRLQAPAQHGQG